MLHLLTRLLPGPASETYNELTTQNLAATELEDARALPSRKQRRQLTHLAECLDANAHDTPSSDMDRQIRTLFGLRDRSFTPTQCVRHARELASRRLGGLNSMHVWDIQTRQDNGQVVVNLSAARLRNDPTPITATAATEACAIARAVIARETMTMRR